MGQYLGTIIYRGLSSALIKDMLFIIYLCLSFGVKLNAAQISCTSGQDPSSIDYNTVPVNITISPFLADYTVLYLIQERVVGGVTATCNSPGGGTAVVGASLLNVAGPGDTSQSGYIIYPTNVNGVGISINANDSGATGPISAWPDTTIIKPFPVTSSFRWMTQDVIIRLWKIPGVIPAGTSPVTVIGPTLVQGIMPSSSADYFNSSMSTPSRSLSSTFWKTSGRNLISDSNLYIGTCNLKIQQQKVYLGEYMNFTHTTPWKDASFVITCPVKAYGYAGQKIESMAMVANTPNKPPAIKIIPYTPIIQHDYLNNVIGGTIALYAGGAEGYGVQLAWGDYTTQSSGVNPSDPVSFNTPISVNTLVNSYPMSLSLGALPPDATIKMAARFIQTEAVPQAGKARAAIEVIANYE